MLKKIIEDINEHWRNWNIEQLVQLLDDNIEVRSTNLLPIYPGSGGVLKGKDDVAEYM